MKLFEKGQQPGTIYVSRQENSAVLLAVKNLAGDIEKICHVRPEIVHRMDERVIIAVSTDGQLADEHGAPRWEGYVQQVCDSRLYLRGNDRRGTIFAIYDLCERMGVSPWYDLGDVPVKEKDVILLPDSWYREDWPSIRYRGIFLNDEEELDAWARKHTTDTTIGPATYARIYELILRLKGNYIWPAMHVNAFNMDPENGQLAERMGVVTGTSHCDMLHRSNQNEWKPWVESKGYEGLQYDYTIPGQNRERLLEYWRGSLQQNRDFECCYTIGMRGIHDTGFVTGGLDTNASPEEQMRGKRELLEEIMRVQRQLIAEELPGKSVPQAFVPYKEVLPIYDSGLQVPDDVTLIWVDDNHGYVRRYPDALEQRRSGGNGLYYHSSYWAAPGMSWLFMSSIPLAHMGNELKKCYEQNIRQIWVDNVGALKPIEQDMEYFLRCGWDAGRENCTMLNAERFTAEWIDRNFSGGHGREAAKIYTAFTQLCNVCKPEHMRVDIFSQTAYGDEAGARVWCMAELAGRAAAIRDALPENERDAFFQLFLMKIQAAFFIAASYYFADRSRATYDLGAMRAAEDNFVKSRAMDDLKRMLLYYYNEKMSDGKWSGILTPEDFPPPGPEQYPACRPALTIGKAGLVIRLPDWGTPGRLCFSPGDGEKWLELFNAGAGSLEVHLEADNGIVLSATRLTLESEARIMVSAERSGEIRVISQGKITVVPVVCTDVPSFIHLRAEEAVCSSGFNVIADIGRGTGSVMEAAADTNESKPASLTLPFELKTAGSYELELIRFLTLRSTGRIRMRVRVDEGPAQEIESLTTDEWRGTWRKAAVSDGEKLYCRLPELAAGSHVLLIEALDPYVTLDCVNVYTRDRVPCMLGPGCLKQRREIPVFDVEALAAPFGMQLEDVPPGRVVYAGPLHWTQDMNYARNEYRQPVRYGRRVHRILEDGTKDVFTQLDPDIIREKNGRLAWDAENVLCQSANAWTDAGADGLKWTHRQAETGGRTGLAMCMDPRPAEERIVCPGPRLNYRMQVEQGGLYRLWLLMKYDDERHFNCNFLLDGVPLREMAKVCRDHMHSFRTVYMWCWQLLAEAPISAGEHVFTMEADGTGMAIDRFWLTTGEEYPPLDEEWDA